MPKYFLSVKVYIKVYVNPSNEHVFDQLNIQLQAFSCIYLIGLGKKIHVELAIYLVSR